MSLLRLIQIMVGLLLVLSTSLVGIGERSMAKTGIMLVAVGASFLLTDLFGWIRLNRFVAGVLALLVMAYSLFDAFKLESQRQLEAIATLQTFLEVILLFQAKNPRLYWQLVVLSLGQVMVACALSIGLLFGAVLLMYAFVAIVTLTLLLLYREHTDIQPTASGFHLGRSISGAQRRSSGDSWSGDESREVAASAPSPRLASLRPVFGHAVALTVLTLGVASIIFFLMPRFNTRAWQGTQDEPLRVVGYSPTVTLGALGAVVQDADVVMRMRLWHPDGKRPYLLAGDPLLRGSVVTRYRHGQWSQGGYRGYHNEIPDDPPNVLQEILIEPLDEPVLFTVAPVTTHRDDGRIGFNHFRQELTRADEYSRERFQFTIGTTGIIDGQQVPVVPNNYRFEGNELGAMLQRPSADGVDPLEGLSALAAQVVSEANLPETDRVGKARALERYLRDSGRFAYSLEGQPRDAKLDPLEDFVTRTPVGHCEYFAGALTMMLRSQGIPARMVIGFKGGEWNAAGGYYQVRQLHAHTWVEAYLEPDHYEPREGAGSDSGWWLLLDPTTASEDDSLNTRGAGWFAGISHYFDYAQVLWGNYVVGLTAEKQEQSIYQPLAEAFTAAAGSMFDRDAWEERFGGDSNAGLDQLWAWYKQNWFNWRGGVAAMAFCLVLLLLVKLVQLTLRLTRWFLIVLRARAALRPPVVEFYARFERAIARHGIRRLPAQTQQEFALAAAGRLAETPELAAVAMLPRWIVDLFYRVRFGGRQLDSSEAARVEHALSLLESARTSGRP